MWRGGNTGVSINERNEGEIKWRDTQRMRLMSSFSGTGDEITTILRSPPDYSGSSTSSYPKLGPADEEGEEGDEDGDGEGSGSGVKGGELIVEGVKTAGLNAALIDVAFTGRAVQCDQKTCAVIEREYDFRKKQTPEEANRYKYFLDVRPFP